MTIVKQARGDETYGDQADLSSLARSVESSLRGIDQMGIHHRESRVEQMRDAGCVTSHTLNTGLTLDIGTMSRSEVVEALAREDVHLNASAEILLADAFFDGAERESITVVERSVAELGLIEGAPLPDILGAALDNGLRLCPPTAGPYLRLAWLTQPNAPDTILSNGRAPTGSLTIASAPLRQDVAYPKGFYLRVIDHQPWLRGYRCDDEHSWSPYDRFVFARAR